MLIRGLFSCRVVLFSMALALAVALGTLTPSLPMRSRPDVTRSGRRTFHDAKRRHAGQTTFCVARKV